MHVGVSNATTNASIPGRSGTPRLPDRANPAGDAAIEGTVTDFGSDDNGGGGDFAENLTVQPDGKIVAAG